MVMFGERDNKPSVYLKVGTFMTNLPNVHFLRRTMHTDTNGYQNLKYLSLCYLCNWRKVLLS
jgi:hypothetical protein